MLKIEINPVCLWHFAFQIKWILKKIKLLIFIFSRSFHFYWIVMSLAVFNTWVCNGVYPPAPFSSFLLSCLAFNQDFLLSALFHPILGWHDNWILFQERLFHFSLRPAGIFFKSFAIFVAYLLPVSSRLGFFS